MHLGGTRPHLGEQSFRAGSVHPGPTLCLVQAEEGVSWGPGAGTSQSELFLPRLTHTWWSQVPPDSGKAPACRSALGKLMEEGVMAQSMSVERAGRHLA